MKRIVYYILLVFFTLCVMIATSYIIGSLIGFDNVGVKGATAGMGLLVIYNKDKVFEWIDKAIQKK